MYNNPQSGQAAAVTAAPNPHRRALMDLLGEATHLITDAEYERAVGNILACQDVTTLQRWYRNCIREIARREEAENTAPVEYATADQKQEITKLGNSTWILRKEKTAVQLRLPSLLKTDATALIGELWAKILRRQERTAESMESASNSFYNAA